MRVGGPLERVVSYNGERATLRGHGLKKCRWGGERQQLLRAERVVEIERWRHRETCRWRAGNSSAKLMCCGSAVCTATATHCVGHRVEASIERVSA